MKKLFTLLALATATMSCDFAVNPNAKVCTGEVKCVEMDFKDFDAIVVNGMADLKVIQEDNFNVKVVANEEVFQYLNYEVKDGTLYLQSKDKIQIRAETFNIYVSLPDLKGIEVNGAADSEINHLTADHNLSIVVNGAGDLEMNDIAATGISIIVNGAADVEAKQIDVETLNVAVNGAADATLKGNAKDVDIKISGAGSIDASELNYTNITTHKAGVASIKTK